MSRFFFAVCPDKLTKKAIINCRKRLLLSGRMINKSNLHLTLLFLGRINVNQRQEIIREASQISCSEFELILTHTGSFTNSRVVWLGPEIVPEPLLSLHKQLLSAAIDCNIPVQPQAYKPHVSLVRNASPVERQSISMINWHVKNFVLLESVDTANGVDYQPVQYFSCA